MPKPPNDLSAPQKDAKAFDAWFYSQSKAEQQRMRESGVLPYREMVQPRRVFEINPGHKAWSYTPETERTEVDAFISREHVGSMLKALLDALATTDDLPVRRHVELVRWTLGIPGHLPAPVIAEMFGVTKQAIHKRAKTIKRQLAPDALDGYAMLDRAHHPGRSARSAPAPGEGTGRINRIPIVEGRKEICLKAGIMHDSLVNRS